MERQICLVSIIGRNFFISIILYLKTLISRIRSCGFGFKNMIDVNNNKDEFNNN